MKRNRDAAKSSDGKSIDGTVFADRRTFMKSLGSASVLAFATGSATAEGDDTGVNRTDETDTDGAIVTGTDSGPEAEAPDGSAYSAADVGELINVLVENGFPEIHVKAGTYTLNTQITAQDGLSLYGHDRPTFEITWENTALSNGGTTYDIAVYTNPGESTSDVTIDGIVFDAVEQPSHESESQIIGDPRNVGTKYNWTIRNCAFDHIPKYAINMDNHENAVVENCRFANGSYWWEGIPLRVHTVRNAEVINCTFSRNENDSSFPDLRLDGYDTDVRGCEFKDITAAGIDVVDDYVTHEASVRISECRFTGSGTGNGITIDHAAAQGNVIENNAFESLEYGIDEVSGSGLQVANNSFENVATKYELSSGSTASENSA